MICPLPGSVRYFRIQWRGTSKASSGAVMTGRDNNQMI